ncbi:diguanylate cyclase domain-containing protein [Aliivibrio wodanis]|uniref:diguanylate cyclase domain-containing protein n=1 Tax=Aliivibrio wodanis TaxID=80852 RepID=UPI00406CA5B4
MTSIQALLIPHHESTCSPYLSVSIGISQIIDHQHILTLNQLIERADKALYTAKEKGRNQYHHQSEGEILYQLS